MGRPPTCSSHYQMVQTARDSVSSRSPVFDGDRDGFIALFAKAAQRATRVPRCGPSLVGCCYAGAWCQKRAVTTPRVCGRTTIIYLIPADWPVCSGVHTAQLHAGHVSLEVEQFVFLVGNWFPILQLVMRNESDERQCQRDVSAASRHRRSQHAARSHGVLRDFRLLPSRRLRERRPGVQVISNRHAIQTVRTPCGSGLSGRESRTCAACPLVSNASHLKTHLLADEPPATSTPRDGHHASAGE